MEKKIRAYEKYIAREAGREMDDATREKLAKYHSEMLKNFQNERLIHLIIMLFFVAFTAVVCVAAAWAVLTYGFALEMTPLYILTIILIILTGCYVKHYYFLENHIQGLYKYIEKLKGF